MRTARLLSLDADSLPPWRQTLLDAYPPGHVTCDACWEANTLPPPPVDRMTDACKNITLPQTSFAGGNNSNESYYRPQRSWVKVIFSQACVCPQGGGVSASVHAGISTPPGPDTPQSRPPGPDTPWDQTPPFPPEQTPPGPDTPPGSRLQHTVYERPVRILLECILVGDTC